MSELASTQTLFDANALIATLTHEGMAGALALIESDQETYPEVDPVYLMAISLLKQTIDGLMPIMEGLGMRTSWPELLSANANSFCGLPE